MVTAFSCVPTRCTSCTCLNILWQAKRQSKARYREKDYIIKETNGINAKAQRCHWSFAKKPMYCGLPAHKIYKLKPSQSKNSNKPEIWGFWSTKMETIKATSMLHTYWQLFNSPKQPCQDKDWLRTLNTQKVQKFFINIKYNTVYIGQ